VLGVADNRINPVLVLPGTARPSIIDETISAFSRLPVAAAIITKLDECDAVGPVLSSVIRHRLPLAFTTNGQQVPEDLHEVVPQSLLADVIRTYKHSQKLAALDARMQAMPQPVMS